MTQVNAEGIGTRRGSARSCLYRSSFPFQSVSRMGLVRVNSLLQGRR